MSVRDSADTHISSSNGQSQSIYSRYRNVHSNDVLPNDLLRNIGVAFAFTVPPATNENARRATHRCSRRDGDAVAAHQIADVAQGLGDDVGEV